MIKLSLGELEEAIANPRAFREKVVNRSTDDSFRPKSYYSQLRNAIFKFHIFGNNAIEGEEYLTTKLFEFTNDTRKKEILDQYNWYVTDIKTNSTRVFGCRYLISIRYLQGITVDLELTGEVGRLDINPSGGYAAWLFRRNKSENWADELRMPLIQEELSKRLNAFPNEIYIGIYSFEEKLKAQVCYSNQEIAEAKTKFDNFAAEYLHL